jgi:cytochrome c-type biogenesis protein CcmH
MRRLLSAVLFLLMFWASALAVQPDEILKNPALEARARALSTGVRCLVCQNQSIDDSDAPLARDLRLLIRERLVAGDSDEKVLGFIVDRYGEFVLLRPRFEAKTILLWGTVRLTASRRPIPLDPPSRQVGGQCRNTFEHR